MVDFKGQQLSEQIFQVVIIASTVVGFIYGYVEQSFDLTFKSWAAGLVISMLLCVPDWPMYRRNPIEWHEADYEDSVSLDFVCVSAVKVELITNIVGLLLLL